MDAHYPSPAKLLAYIQGKLSAAEVAEIEDLIASDPGLAADIEEMRLFAKAQGESAVEMLEKHEMSVEKAIPARRNYFWYGVVLSLLMVLGVGSWFLFSKKEKAPNPEELLACGESSAIRGSNQEVWRQILSLCGEGDYGQMISRLEEWLTTQPDDAEAKIYLGRALALEGRYEEAEAVFISIETDARILPQTRLDAQWYMALSMIKAGDVERACEILEAIQPLLGSNRQEIAANFTQNICGK